VRILITGSEGFVGSHLNPEGELLCIDLKQGVDICDPDTADVIRAFDPEVVYHLAAHHFIPWCNDHPSDVDRLNIAGTGRMLAACGPSLRSFVLASSAAVYGFSDDPLREDSPRYGRDVYARSKIHAERLLRDFSALHPQVSCVAARLFNVVGRGDPWPHVLPAIVDSYLEGGTIPLGNTWPRRDYVHVDDVAEALQFLAEAAPVGASAYNVGTGRGTSVAELVVAVYRAGGRALNLEPSWSRSRSDDGHLVADPTALGLLGWSASRTLEDAIGDVLGPHARAVAT
jgi:UDP-glucose 4-epimerase